MLKQISRILLFSFLVLGPAIAYSQDLDARSPKPMPVSKKQKKADVKKEKQKAKLDKAIAKGKKRHLSHQSKETKKMIKRSRKKSTKWNSR